MTKSYLKRMIEWAGWQFAAAYLVISTALVYVLYQKYQPSEVIVLDKGWEVVVTAPFGFVDFLVILNHFLAVTIAILAIVYVSDTKTVRERVNKLKKTFK